MAPATGSTWRKNGSQPTHSGGLPPHPVDLPGDCPAGVPGPLHLRRPVSREQPGAPRPARLTHPAAHPVGAGSRNLVASGGRDLDPGFHHAPVGFHAGGGAESWSGSGMCSPYTVENIRPLAKVRIRPEVQSYR